MSKQSKNLKKAYSNVIDDIFDNFDKYTDEEKSLVQRELSHLENLNSLLEKYDKKSLFEWIRGLFDNATGKK